MYIARKDATGQLILLYLLVDKVKLPQQRNFRNIYDKMLPELYTAFTGILADSFAAVYSKAFDAAMAEIMIGKIPRLPPNIPSASKYGAMLVPTYGRR
jgi:hypothetical protein